MQWVDGNGWIACRSTCGLYLIQRMVSPQSYFMAMFRPSLFDLQPVSEMPRASLAEAQDDADQHLKWLAEQKK